jgi:pilus assembly protein CpaC
MFMAIRALAVMLAVFAMAAGLDVRAGGDARADSIHRSNLTVPANAGGPVSRSITLGLSKSMVVEFPRDVRDILVSDPTKVDAVVSTARRAYLIGMTVGQANAFFFDENGEQMLALEVRVERDLAGITEMINKLMPGSNIMLEAVNDNVILTGSVANPSDATRASDIASRLVGEKEKVLNMLAVEASEQVALKVTVVEMERNMLKQLGVTWDGEFNFGDGVLGFGVNPAFPLNNALGDLFSVDGGDINVLRGANGIGGALKTGSSTTLGTLKLLEQNGLVRTLAEPTLTAISGETANFLAGGEFPIPVAQDSDTISIEFKPFGVGLAFTPTVMSEGLISLKVSTEVSELTNEGAITLSAITIPALKVRRANTTIELPSGGSLVIAGLISEETRHAVEGQPGLKNLPILGTLFRSRDFIKSESELVVIVTPYTVNPVARKDLVRPDKNFANSSDSGAYFHGRLNRVDRPQRGIPSAQGVKSNCCYQGNVGYIVE